mmetsp:Transcript_24686/g.57024  ORF Transcript_24686/g.57024 Transcript_24686/m.57024 type:complete len:261 (-) Transcript_24686:84-866(-)
MASLPERGSARASGLGPFRSGQVDKRDAPVCRRLDRAISFRVVVGRLGQRVDMNGEHTMGAARPQVQVVATSRPAPKRGCDRRERGTQVRAGRQVQPVHKEPILWMFSDWQRSAVATPIEQIAHDLPVYLEARDTHPDVTLVAGLLMLKQPPDPTRDQPLQIFCCVLRLLAEDRMRLPRPCLAVCEDGRAVSLHRGLEELLDAAAFENLLLRCRRVESLGAGEELAIHLDGGGVPHTEPLAAGLLVARWGSHANAHADLL